MQAELEKKQKQKEDLEKQVKFMEEQRKQRELEEERQRAIEEQKQRERDEEKRKRDLEETIRSISQHSEIPCLFHKDISFTAPLYSLPVPLFEQISRNEVPSEDIIF